MASDAVFKYLMDTNRPYSCADVTVNLRGAFGKTAVQKALDALSEAGKIKCKLYGKQKVYSAIQTETTTDDGEIEDFDTQFKTLTKSLEDNSNTLKTAESSLKVLISTPTTETAKAIINDTKLRIECFNNKLETLRTSTAVLSADEKKAILNEHDKHLREYRKRKRICSEMLEAVMEGYPKSKKALLEDLCIETDEMVGFKLISSS